MRSVVAAWLLHVALLQAAYADDNFPGPYFGAVVDVVDGDTFTARVEIWPDIQALVSVRLRGVDAPEIRRAACEGERAMGRLATQRLVQELFENNPEGLIRLNYVEADSFSGRIVAEVHRDNPERDTPLLGQLLPSDTLVPWDPSLPDIDWCKRLPLPR